MSQIILHPIDVAALMDKLSPPEVEQLDAYASAAVDGKEFVIRASQWLIDKFGPPSSKLRPAPGFRD